MLAPAPNPAPALAPASAPLFVGPLIEGLLLVGVTYLLLRGLGLFHGKKQATSS